MQDVIGAVKAPGRMGTRHVSRGVETNTPVRANPNCQGRPLPSICGVLLDRLRFPVEINQACGQLGRKTREAPHLHTYFPCTQKGTDVRKPPLHCIRDVSLAGGELVPAALC